MKSFEAEIRDWYTNARGVKFIDNTNSSTKLDFEIQQPVARIPRPVIFLEAKEKKQTYAKHWTDEIPEEYLFILDEVTVRKVVMSGPMTVIAVRDTSKGVAKYHLLPFHILPLMPRIKTLRQWANGTMSCKWLVDFRNFPFTCSTFDQIPSRLYPLCTPQEYTSRISNWCSFAGESIDVRGTVRKAGQNTKDFLDSR